MANKNTSQPELLMETPAIVTAGEPGDPSAEKLELIDDTPDVVRMDLRKFNKTHRKIGIAVKNVTGIAVIETQEGADKMMGFLKELDAVGKVVEAKRKELGDPYRLEWVRVNDYVKDLVKEVDPAIKVGKAKILAFHKAEEQKAKDKRTAARIDALKALNLSPRPRKIGDKEVIDWAFVNGAIITAGQLEELPDDIYIKTIEETVAAIQQANLQSLQKEKEGADFFGETDAATAIDKQITEVKAAPRAIASYGGFSGGTTSAKGLTKRWTFEITDLSQVPREYLQVDEKKVKEAIAAGTRVIPGIRIYQDESISLR